MKIAKKPCFAYAILVRQATGGFAWEATRVLVTGEAIICFIYWIALSVHSASQSHDWEEVSNIVCSFHDICIDSSISKNTSVTNKVTVVLNMRENHIF